MDECLDFCVGLRYYVDCVEFFLGRVGVEGGGASGLEGEGEEVAGVFGELDGEGVDFVEVYAVRGVGGGGVCCGSGWL